MNHRIDRRVWKVGIWCKVEVILPVCDTTLEDTYLGPVVTIINSNVLQYKQFEITGCFQFQYK